MAKLLDFHDGSELCLVNASELCNYPIWKGNRILDKQHKLSIKNVIGDNVRCLDIKPFHCVRYMKEVDVGVIKQVTEIVDGQHRAAIIREYFEKNEEYIHELDFQVMVITKCCKDELDIIQYFRILNKTKSIEWKEDSKMAVLSYMEALLSRFNSPKKILIRDGKTRAPYISSDSIRDELVRIKIHLSGEPPFDWANRIWKLHNDKLDELSKKSVKTKEEEACIKSGCLLGYSDTLQWLEPII
jgi:hypothetical protein